MSALRSRVLDGVDAFCPSVYLRPSAVRRTVAYMSALLSACCVVYY